MEKPFLIRSARESDLEGLLRLSKLVYFINLPSDRDVIKEKIRLSVESFAGNVPDKFSREYILVVENPIDQSVVGTSMIMARHGSPACPHMYFELKELQKYSETIHSGLIHRLLRLKFDYDGPTEIGGLVVDPSFRKHPAKIGRQLSYARFLFIKMKRRWFKNYVLSELMPPLTDTGESVLWEALGRKFTNLSYQEADALSRKNKEFVTSLFPRVDIYTCLLPGEVRDAIGKVGSQAAPVKHMLETIGFSWKEHIDPFDGGPHFWAETDKISVVRHTSKIRLGRDSLKRRNRNIALCGVLKNGEFLCTQTPFELHRRRVCLPRLTSESLQLLQDEPLHITPLVSGTLPTTAVGHA